MFNRFDHKIDSYYIRFQTYLRENVYILLALTGIALSAYGFALFNFNLSIDDEIHAAYNGPVLQWIAEGRWGMYILDVVLLPYTIIPFVPLFLALSFHITAILLMLESWEVKTRLERIIIGAVCIAYPGMAFIYTFYTINFGVGFGLFCVALSLFIYSKSTGRVKWLAVIPAAFAISIYQGFIPALISGFVISLICDILRSRQHITKELITISVINLLAFSIYFLIDQLFVLFGRTSTTGYVASYFRIGSLQSQFGYVVGRTWSYLVDVYSGGKAIYGVQIRGFGPLMIVLIMVLGANLLRSSLPILMKTFAATFTLVLLLLPFATGLFTGGYIAMRFLVSLPIVISGLTMLAMRNNSRILTTVIAILVGFCVFEFVVAVNHLFAASSLALQEDRLLGSQLIERIDKVRTDAVPESLDYMEIIGYPSRPATALIPKIETFGASFFEWDEGNVGRVLAFLQTLGFQGLEPLPLYERSKMIEVGNSMPVWPDMGSVQIVGDTVLIKFGPYSITQKQQICRLTPTPELLRYPDFCK